MLLPKTAADRPVLPVCRKINMTDLNATEDKLLSYTP